MYALIRNILLIVLLILLTGCMPNTSIEELKECIDPKPLYNITTLQKIQEEPNCKS